MPGPNRGVSPHADTHAEVIAVRRRQDRLAIAVVSGIVVALLPAFMAINVRNGEWAPLALNLVAWVLDAIALLALRKGRAEVARTLMLTAMALIIAHLYLFDATRGSGFLVLLTVPLAIGFVTRMRAEIALNSLYGLAFGLAIVGVIPTHWAIPADPAARFTLIATYAMIGVLSRALMAARETGNARLEWVATHDADTGLPTRAFLEQGEIIPHGVVAGIAIRSLSDIAERHGHTVLRRLRSETAQRIRFLLPKAQIGQYGEAVYRVCFPEATTGEVVRDVDTLLRRLRAPIATPGVVITPQIDAALVEVGSPLPTVDVHRRLDITVRAAREDGVSTVVWFTPELEETSRLRTDRGDRLVTTIADGRLDVAYQPIIYSQSHRAPDVEVLVRWIDPVEGPIPPSAFIPIAEERGVIGAITAFVIRRAWSDLGDAVAAGRVGRIWVNLSPVDLASDDFGETFFSTFDGHAIDRTAFAVELTEGTLIDERVLARGTLADLRGAGFPIAIDDFGTGFSNLNYLHQLDIDRLKVDRSFVHGIGGDARRLAIVRAIIQLAASLGLNTVAEGVEDAGDCDLMRSLGIDACQGYHTGRPMTADALLSTLSSD